MDEIIERIREKLARIRERRVLGASFGDDDHCYRLGPPLSEEDLLAFESEHGIRLPEEYRCFLALVGNGGAGPGYGLRPLARWSEADVGTLSKPFLMPVDAVWDRAEGEDVWLQELGGPDWEDEYNRGAWSPFDGLLTLFHHGCSGYTMLVVTGPGRGRMCVVYELLPPQWIDARDFFAYYESWLDQVLASREGVRVPEWNGGRVRLSLRLYGKLLALGVLSLGVLPALYWWVRVRRFPKALDDEGIELRDGRRIPWGETTAAYCVGEGGMHMSVWFLSGPDGAEVTLDPSVFRDGPAVIQFARARRAANRPR